MSLLSSLASIGGYVFGGTIGGTIGSMVGGVIEGDDAQNTANQAWQWHRHLYKKE